MVVRAAGCGRKFGQTHTGSPSGFGFAVAAHRDDPRTAWFVPAVKDACRVPVEGRFVVTRTRDGGASFATLGEGLPQAAAYDLVYRHALAVDAAGQSLAMCDRKSVGSGNSVEVRVGIGGRRIHKKNKTDKTQK